MLFYCKKNYKRTWLRFSSVKTVFELSKEHPTLPYSEICGCLQVYDIRYEIIEYNKRFLVVESDKLDIDAFTERLAMTFSLNQVISKSLDGFIKNIEMVDSFKVEGGTKEFRLEFGKIISEEKRIKVNLENPRHIVKVFKGKKTYFCSEQTKINRGKYEKRRPSKRPFSVPTGIHPRIARALVNIAQLKENDVFLDPFCGAGGLLIEAGLLGGIISGIDIKKQLIDGCKQNLEFYGLKNFKLINEDIRDVTLEPVDVVVTDFPYGRSSHISDEQEQLYLNAFKLIADITKKAVIGMPSLKYNKHIKRWFTIKQIHCFRSHRSLTRFFYVLEAD